MPPSKHFLFTSSAILTFLLLPSPAAAAINPHPRLWLTPASLSTLQARAAENTKQWQTMISEANSLYGKLSTTTDQTVYIHCFALAYAVLSGMGDPNTILSKFGAQYTANQYGTYAIQIATSSMNYRISVCSGGICSNTSPPTDIMAFINTGWIYALVYDWCYPLLSASAKTFFVTNLGYCTNHQVSYINSASQAFASGGGPGWNIYNGTWKSIQAIGYATYGDNPTDSGGTNFELTSWYNAWNNGAAGGPGGLSFFTGTPAWTYGALGMGGVDIEGAAYGWSLPAQWSDMWYAAITAEGNDIRNQLPGLIHNIIQGIIHATSPTTTTAFGGLPGYEPLQYGDQYDDHSADHTLIEAAHIAGLRLSNVATGDDQAYINYWIDNYDPIWKIKGSGTGYNWMEFLYRTSTWPIKDYRSSVTTDYRAVGAEIFSMRSDWTANATWDTFQSGYETTSHAHQAEGNVTIYRKGQWLALDVMGYSQTGAPADFHNLVQLKGTGDSIYCGPLVYGKYVGPPTVVAYEDTSNYAYVRGNEGPSYNGMGVATTYCTYTNNVSLVREFVYIRPDYHVVFDKSTTATPSLGKWQLSSQTTNVAVNGSTATVTSNGQSLVVNPLLPVGMTPLIENWGTDIPNVYWNAAQYAVSSFNKQAWLSGWTRTSYLTPSASNTQQFLVAMQSADAGTAPVPMVSIVNGPVTAAHIKDPAGDWVVAFDNASPTGNFTLPISYTYSPAASVRSHLIVDLPPSTPVTVQIVSNTVTVSGPSGPGTAFTTSPNGTLAFADANGKPAPICDWNGAINQALGTLACATGDVNHDGQCNVFDVQLLANMIVGGSCAQ